VRKNRHSVAEDNPFLKMEQMASTAITTALDSFRETRDTLSESLFRFAYGTAGFGKIFPPKASTPARRTPRAEATAEVAEAWYESGGLLAAVLRMVAAAVINAGVFDRRSPIIFRKLIEQSQFKGAKPQEVRKLFKQQAKLVRKDADRAISALAVMLPTPEQRQGRFGVSIRNPITGEVYADGVVPSNLITPFARLQAYTGTQNAFTETSAQSLNLSVAAQTTNSLRSVIGAQLGGAVDLGWREKLALQFRLGWSHEYANTARPVTATLGGAPLMPFTTYGIAPTRDGAVVGFSANTAIADATSMYLRYEGNVSGQDSAHALTAGVRMSW
jgi:hypothetical protein